MHANMKRQASISVKLRRLKFLLKRLILVLEWSSSDLYIVLSDEEIFFL